MNGDTLVSVERVTVRFRTRVRGRRDEVTALDDVNVCIGLAETVGVVGESGSGKSTLGRVVLGLVRPGTGRVSYEGNDYRDLGKPERARFRKAVQIVHQDPYSSLNPTRTGGEVLSELVGVHQRLKGAPRNDRVLELLKQVGLGPEHAVRYPEALSGGQRQRLALARALATKPSLIVCDEALSALDLSTQAQIVATLTELQRDSGLSYLFISHDLEMVRQLADRTVVVYAGQVMEMGPSRRVAELPFHPYTEALLAASPVADPVEQARRRANRRRLVTGDPSESSRGGCAFAGRCHYVMPVCQAVRPVFSPVNGGGIVACHLYRDGTADRSCLEGRDGDVRS